MTWTRAHPTLIEFISQPTFRNAATDSAECKRLICSKFSSAADREETLYFNTSTVEWNSDNNICVEQRSGTTSDIVILCSPCVRVWATAVIVCSRTINAVLSIMQIPVCYIDQRDIMYNKYYYTGTYRILSLLENITPRRGVAVIGLVVGR